MAKDLDKNVLEELNKKVDVLLKKFSEQKGIIDGYVKRERDWKKNKTLNLKKIKNYNNRELANFYCERYLGIK